MPDYKVTLIPKNGSNQGVPFIMKDRSSPPTPMEADEYYMENVNDPANLGVKDFHVDIQEIVDTTGE